MQLPWKKRRQEIRKIEFLEFLRSAEGRQAILKLAPEILVGADLAPYLTDVRQQLKVIAGDEIGRFKLDLEKTLGDFLQSYEGKRLMLDLVKAALAEGELTSVLNGAEQRLKVLAQEEVATHMGRAERTLTESAEAHAAAFKCSASDEARNLASQVAHDVEQQLSSYRDSILEAVEEQLPAALREEVARHVRAGPLFSPTCSNRALAAAHGMSIREVKRQRRLGYFQ